MVCDTSYLLYRAFFGVPTTIHGPDGRPVNALRGLLDTLARLIDEYQPTHVVCCWDNDWRPAWRVELVPSYKAHRLVTSTESQEGSGISVEQTPDDLAPQVPLAADLLTAAGLGPLGVDGYEADDVIGSLCAQASVPTMVVTGDRDLFQVVDDARDVTVLYLAQGMGKRVRVDEAWVRERYGISPSQYADFATLRGDASDGLPGVAGIGDKSAAALLATHGSLEGILRAAGTATMPGGLRSKLVTQIDYIAAARTVVGVVTDLDLGEPDLTLAEPPDVPAFTQLAASLGLASSAGRLLTALRASATQRSGARST